jgi:signal transduction histidine kinase
MSDSSEGNEPPESQELEYRERLIHDAEALFFFREIALGVFHQVANHLSIIGSSMLILEFLCEKENAGQEIKEQVKQLKNEAKTAMEMLHIAQKRGQSLKPFPRKCLLVSDLIMPAIAYVGKRAEEASISIRYSLTKNDYEVLLDEELVREALLNILINAFWAIKAKKNFSKKEIFIAIRELTDGHTIKIEISDSGIGISPENFRNLFMPFFTTRPGGTGLGLFFARKVIEEFGGSISIPRSYPNKGTTVEIKIPIGTKFQRY